MPTNPGVSEVQDKNGVIADIEAKRFDGTRTVQIQGDVTATQTWNGDSNTALTLNASIGAKKVTQDKIGDKAVGSGQMADGSVGLTQMAASAMTDTVSANNSKLVTSQGVNAAIAAATLNRGKDYGPLSVDEINAISETIPTGSTVYVKSLGASDAKVINDGYSDGTMASFSVDVGEDLKYYRAPDNSLHGWYSTEANVKTKQPANYAGGIAVDSAQDASSGSAGIEFIQSFKQDTNGNLRDIVKAQVDIVDSTSSTRTDAAATPNSVKSAYDLANGKYSKPYGGIPKSDLASGVQGSLDKADSALQGVKLAGASSALTPDANKVVTVPNAVPTGTGETNGLMTAADKAKLDGITSGANKVEDSDANGNIKIDGVETNVYTHPSAGPSSTTSVGDTTNQTPAFGGTFKAISQTVNTDGHTTATSEHTVTLPTDGKDLTSTVSTENNYTNPGSTATALKTLFGKIWNFIGRLRTSWQTTPDDTHFPSEKLVKDSLDAISTAAGADAEVTAAALDDLDARMQSVEYAVNSDNIGDKIADSLDAQVLKVGGQDVVANIEYVAAQSGGGGDLMKTVAGTQTSVLRFMNDSEAVSIWNDAKQAAANAS